MTATAASGEMSLRLTDPQSSPAGAALRLVDGDLLLAVNGMPFHGDAKELAARLAQGKGKPSALTLQRGSETLIVLSDTARLGQWEEVTKVKVDAKDRINPDILSNYEIFRSRTGSYDLQPLKSGILALIAAPVWLLQMRLWSLGASLIAAAMVAFAVSPLMALAVYLVSGLHIWRAGPAYFRADRKARGLQPHLVLAAASERAAHASYRKFEPQAQFLFSAAPRAAKAAS
jgi:hypothetical protein